MSVFAIARQAALALALSGLAAPLMAASTITDADVQIISAVSVTRTAPVRFGDLDLQDRGDRARLGRRIRFAADTVCAMPDESIVDTTSDFQLCHDRAVAGARAALADAIRSGRGRRHGRDPAALIRARRAGPRRPRVAATRGVDAPRAPSMTRL